MSTGKVTVGYERLQGRDHIRGIECFSLLDFKYFVIEKKCIYGLQHFHSALMT